MDRAQEEEDEQLWVSHWKAGPRKDGQVHGDGLLVRTRDRCQFATRGTRQKLGSEELLGLADFSSKEFFGLHCQMPVQLCNRVVGHLADLQKHKVRQPDNWGWKRVGEKYSRTTERLSGK